ncbi:MAG: hypothetical protein ACRDP7_00355 [Trebonia sp.]
MPDLPIVAEGENVRGEHWYLKAGGSPADYYTMLETLHPDGRRDEGGMGGASLYPGSRYNPYTGRADDGPLRVIVRTDLQVRRLRLSIRTTRDETLDLVSLAEDPEVGLAFFATLLPQPAELLSIQGFGDDGEPLPEPAPAPAPTPHLPPMTASPAVAVSPRAVNTSNRP